MDSDGMKNACATSDLTAKAIRNATSNSSGISRRSERGRGSRSSTGAGPAGSGMTAGHRDQGRRVPVGAVIVLRAGAPGADAGSSEPLLLDLRRLPDPAPEVVEL